MRFKCDGCGQTWEADELESSQSYGGIIDMPYGACPSCKAPVYPEKDAEPDCSTFRKKLQHVMEICRHVKREGAATETDRDSGTERVKFRFFTNDSMVQSVAQAFSEANLIMLPHEVLKIEDLPQIVYRSGSIVNRVRAWVKFTIGDAESNETVSGVSVSEGLDAGSKAIETAITFAKKKFFEIQFLMGSGDFEEANEAQYEAALSIAKSASTEDMLMALRMKARSAARSVGGMSRVAEMLPGDSLAILSSDPEDWDAGLCERIIKVVKEAPAKADTSKEKTALGGMVDKIGGSSAHRKQGSRRGEVAPATADGDGGN